MNTTIPTGWIPNTSTNLRQSIIHALAELSQYEYSAEREDARLALQNTMDCMERLAAKYRESETFHNPTVGEMVAAAYMEGNADPRTPAQIDLDIWQAETELTRQSDFPF